MPIQGPLPAAGDGSARRKTARFAPNGDGFNLRISAPVMMESGAGVVSVGAALVDVATFWLMPPPALEQAVDIAQHSAPSAMILEASDLRIQPPFPTGIRWLRCRKHFSIGGWIQPTPGSNQQSIRQMAQSIVRLPEEGKRPRGPWGAAKTADRQQSSQYSGPAVGCLSL